MRVMYNKKYIRPVIAPKKNSNAVNPFGNIDISNVHISITKKII
jgi:hypothetical protein